MHSFPRPRRASHVVITGLGVISPIGDGIEEFRRALLQGRHGIRPQRRFATPELARTVAATLPTATWNARLTDRTGGVGPDPCAEAAIAAAREALRGSGIEGAAERERVAVVLGTSTGGLFSRSCYEHCPRTDSARRHAFLEQSGFHVQTARLARALDLRGPRLTVSTACASSTHAVGLGRELLLAGLADVVLAGGVDLIVEEVFAGFHAMAAMAPGPCAPFSEPMGMTVGEGAGFVLLEALDRARTRGARLWAELLGFGSSSDAFHATAPDPTGAGIARALRAALGDAQVAPEAIRYFNAHGTGTEANDAAEWRAIERVFGEHARVLPVSSTKSYFGHALGAAGALELIASVLALEAQVALPTLHFTTPRKQSPTDPVAEPVPRSHAHDIGLSESLAFGGANAAVVYGRVRGAEVPELAPERVFVVGSGVLAAHGHQGFDAALRRGVPVWKPLATEIRDVPMPTHAGLIPSESVVSALRAVDTRGMDRVSRHLTAATLLALQAAGLRLRGELRERTALAIGAYRLPWDSSDEFWESIRQRGVARASASAFSRIVMNGAAGALTRALRIQGPVDVLANGPGAGLHAVGLAAQHLCHRRDADLAVAGAASELGSGMLADHAHVFPESHHADLAFPVYGDFVPRPTAGEAAACWVLAQQSAVESHELRPLVEVKGYGTSGPDGLALAIRQALALGGVAQEEVDAIYGSADGTRASARREEIALREVFDARLSEIPLSNPAPVFGAQESLDVVALAAAVEGLVARRAHPTFGCAAPGLNLSGTGPRPLETALVVCAHELSGSVALVLRGVRVPDTTKKKEDP